MNRTLWTRVGRAFRRMALPLIAYYGITLALPLMNGAARSGAAFAAFVDHALIVLVVPAAIIVLAGAVDALGNATVAVARALIARR
ncbi:MAG TPA: hypothetical protein VKB50_12740 [Vicinamibacterales bacterium]|nr:hypothetical protein [Vicinamibacterales bacterium]